MTINEYYKKLNAEINRIFEESMKSNNIQGNTHDLINNLQTWYQLLKAKDASNMLLNAIEEIDISCLQMLQGIYRGAFASLRLSLKMFCGFIYFSSHNIDYVDWTKGNKDLQWSYLLDNENGILSVRFSKAYFEDLNKYVSNYQDRTRTLYRGLSEMVHGNYETWDYNNPTVLFNNVLRNKYFEYIETYYQICNFILSLRFLKSFSPNEIQEIETHIIDSVSHIEAIRILIGGPK